jgi:hypothetical protein
MNDLIKIHGRNHHNVMVGNAISEILGIHDRASNSTRLE